jgi:hypothetical protein
MGRCRFLLLQVLSYSSLKQFEVVSVFSFSGYLRAKNLSIDRIN